MYNAQYAENWVPNPDLGTVMREANVELLLVTYY